MRFAAFLIAVILAAPALAAGWTTYANARYGATADIPPGFTATGPEAANSDGLTFWDKKGSMIIVYGADVPGGNFEAYAESRYEHARDYDHWSNLQKTVTPTWAEISGSSGRAQMRIRLVASCNGKQAVAVSYEAPSISSTIVSRLFRSLTAGPARSC